MTHIYPNDKHKSTVRWNFSGPLFIEIEWNADVVSVYFWGVCICLCTTGFSQNLVAHQELDTRNLSMQMQIEKQCVYVSKDACNASLQRTTWTVTGRLSYMGIVLAIDL